MDAELGKEGGQLLRLHRRPRHLHRHPSHAGLQAFLEDEPELALAQLPARDDPIQVDLPGEPGDVATQGLTPSKRIEGLLLGIAPLAFGP